jgi:GNAT superfamily N-acetyltransferase
MSSSRYELRVVEAAPEYAELLAALFEREACACYCRYFHFPGDKNAWLARLAHAPHENRSEMLTALGARADEMRGVIALSDAEHAVGWMKLCPATAVEKLYAQRIYRGLPCFSGDRSGVYAVGCFLVDSEHRERGVARALLEAGIEAARRSGARAIEAFPRRTEPAYAHELWTGPASIFSAAGFREAHAFAPYPVLRLDL